MDAPTYADNQGAIARCSMRCPYLAVLLLKRPPKIVTTVEFPHATTAPPSSSAWLSLNVPPSIVTLEPPKSLLSPEQYT